MIKINNFSIVPKYIIFLLDLGATVTALFIAILIQQNVALATTNYFFNAVGECIGFYNH
jgi:hypothetical protein